MKKPKKVKPFARLMILLYLCSVKRIKYNMPVEWVRGNISGRQLIEYNGGRAYGIPTGSSVTADAYQPRIVAKVLREYEKTRLLYYQVRTRTSVNMTDKMRLNLALMGGVGALLGSLLKMKESAIYRACVTVKPDQVTLREFLAPIIRNALANKEEYIAVASGVQIVNPWVSSAEPNVPVPSDIINKFNGVLGHEQSSPYSAQTTEALQAQFPTQWPTIRDYGFTHPALVPFINEDPMLVMSLIDGLGTRWIVGDGNSWVDSGVYAQSGTTISTKVNVADITIVKPFGCRASSTNYVNSFYFVYNEGWNDKLRVVNGTLNIYNTFRPTTGIHNISLGPNIATWDNNTFNTSSNSGTSKTIKIIGMDYGNVSEGDAAGNEYQFFDLKNTSGGDLYFVPFVSEYRNGMLEIHDLNHPIFYPNQGTGIFTTQEDTT